MSDPVSPRVVDPWRFTGRFLQGLLSARIPAEPTHPPIPWAPVTKPLARSKVALVSTAGISMRGDAPFDMEGERRRPTWGDPSWRRLRADATAETVEVNHLHIDTSYAKRDLDVALPVDRLRELVAAGVVGAMADEPLFGDGLPGRRHDRARDAQRPRDRRRDAQRGGRPRRSSPPSDPTAAGPWDWSHDVIEAAGIPTVTLNLIWVYHRTRRHAARRRDRASLRTSLRRRG